MNLPTNSSILTLTARLLFVQIIKFSTLGDCFPEVNTRFPYLGIHLCKFENSNNHNRNVTHLKEFTVIQDNSTWRSSVAPTNVKLQTGQVYYGVSRICSSFLSAGNLKDDRQPAAVSIKQRTLQTDTKVANSGLIFLLFNGTIKGKTIILQTNQIKSLTKSL